jgi:multicomponent Na+:H+ antiporter subunit D
MSALLSLLVALPLGAAAVSVALSRFPRTQWVVALVTVGATLVMATVVLVVVDTDGTLRTDLGGWPGRIAISLVADRLAAVMLVLGAAMLFAVLVYALGQGGGSARSPYYVPAYLVLSAGISAAFLAGDLFNLFVAFEILLMASYVLITLEGNDDQIRAGTTYVVINVVESLLLFLAVGFVFAATGTLSMSVLPGRLADLPTGVAVGLNVMLLIAFGLKAAVFPLFSWLPDSYPAALSPVSAVFAGLLTKVGVYALIRTETLLFPGGQRALLLVIAGITMVIGGLGAIAQVDMKRILSFHIVSQIGYMVAGLALGGIAALSATVFFVIHQIPTKTALFLVEGVVEHDTGTSALDRVGGLARRSGVFAAMFLIPALSLAGIPPFSGFVAKLGLIEAGFSGADYVIIGVALAASLLTLVSMVKIWTGVFWGEPQPHPRGRVGLVRHHRLMSGVTAATVALCLAIALAAGPIWGFCERTAHQLVATEDYGREGRK